MKTRRHRRRSKKSNTRYIRGLSLVSYQSRSPKASSDYKAADPALEAWKAIANSYRLLKKEEEIELCKRIKQGDNEARVILLSCNLRLVTQYVLRHYQEASIPMVDLIKEGLRGLDRAIDRFDWRKGYKFSTYATWWIRQSVLRALSEEGRIIRLPVHMSEAVREAQRDCERFNLDFEPKNVAQLKDITSEDAEKICRVDRQTRVGSLDYPLRDGDTIFEEGSTLIDHLADEDAVDPLEAANTSVITDEILKMIEKLPKRERTIFKLRNGINTQDGSELTLEEIGNKFDLTRERVRQIEMRAIKKLRRWCKNGKSKVFAQFL